MVHLPHQERALGRKGLEAVPRLAHLRLGGLLGAAQPDRMNSLLDRGGQKRKELLTDRLHDIIGGAGLEGGNGDAALLRPGHIDDGRGVGQRSDARQRLEPVLARHVVIERHDIDAALLDPTEAAVAILRDLDRIAAPLQPLLDEAGQTRVVIDIQDAERPVGHAASGT